MVVDAIKKDFEIFGRAINGKPIVYLDSAATSLKPKLVVDAVRKYYEEYTANINRGVYLLSEESTEAYEVARKKMAKFINAYSEKEIVFVRNATEAINLVMYSWGGKNIGRSEEIVVTGMEHHANLVPWQVLCKEKGAVLKIVNLNSNGTLNEESLLNLITSKTKLLAISHVSNVLGTINNIREIVVNAKSKNSNLRVLVDGAQAVPHMKVEVRDLGCDWYVFSGHKMLGPTGIGVLWGKQELREKMNPFMYGGDMIREVRFDDSTWNDVPHKFEAGTPHIAGAIGLGAAVDYLESLDMNWVRTHEMELVRYAMEKLSVVKDLTVYGPTDVTVKGGVVAFNLKGVHPHDVAQVLDEDNVYIRAGHHCAMPLHTEILKVPATCRASFYVYNNKDDVDQLIESIEKVKLKFKQ